MSNRWMLGAVIFVLISGAANAAPPAKPDVAVPDLSATVVSPKVKAWIERAIERMFDETAHVAQLSSPLR